MAVKSIYKITRLSIGLGLLAIITAEIFLRLIFWGGVSTQRSGRLSNGFYQDRNGNKYNNQRGLHYTNPINKNQLRVLVQGDSITWGQGIKNSKDSYPSVLKERLLNYNNQVEIAVIAKQGYETLDHLDNLEKWGEALQPNIIIYQWHITDLEVDRQRRPKKTKAPWTYIPLHNKLRQKSYLWHFLDIQLSHLLPKPRESYEDYLLKTYASNTSNWKKFRTQFINWLSAAKKLTSNIILVIPLDDVASSLQNEVIDLAKENNIKVLVLSHKINGMATSEFDSHPNKAAHKIMAQEIAQDINLNFPYLNE